MSHSPLFIEIIFEIPTVEMGFKFWDVGYRKKIGPGNGISLFEMTSPYVTYREVFQS